MLNQATITEICKYVNDRQTFFNFVNCCKFNQQFDYLFFDHYQIYDSSFRDYPWKILIGSEKNETFINFLRKIINLNSSSHIVLKTISYINTILRVVNISSLEPIPILPSAVKSVTIDVAASQIDSISNLPDSIENLTVPGVYNHIVEKLPKNLVTLEITYESTLFIQKWPANLKKLILGTRVFPYNMFGIPDNYGIDNIPDTIEELTLGFYFNDPVKRWPTNLVYLNTCGNFNQPLDNLPYGLKILELGRQFNQPLDKLPESVEVVIYNCEILIPLDKLPHSVKRLTVKHLSQCLNIPDFIEVIDIIEPHWGVITKYPSSLKRLNVPRIYYYSHSDMISVDKDKIFFID